MLEAGLALLFGLVIGSFLNVCIYRMPRDLSVVRPRSHCIACDRPIAWYDNVPLLSYLILGGQCRYCKAKIALRYPLVEFLTGLLFFGMVWHFGPTPAALKLCVYGALLIGLFFSDLEERILPDEFTLGGAVLGLVFAWFVPVKDGTVEAVLWMIGQHWDARWTSLAESAIGGGLPSGILWVGGWLYLKLRHREGLGLGDVKLMLMVGAFTGLHGALLTLIIGSLAGSVIGYSYIKITKQDPSTYELPFGTFLAAAALLVPFL